MFPCLCLKFYFIFSKALSRTDGFSTKKDKSNPFKARLPLSCFLYLRFQTLYTLIYLITVFPCLTGYLNVLRQFLTFSQIKQNKIYPTLEQTIYRAAAFRYDQRLIRASSCYRLSYRQGSTLTSPAVQ